MNRSPDSTGTGSAPPPDRQAGTPHLNGTTPDLGVAAPPDLDVAARAAEADLPTGPEKTALVRSMFDTIAPRYDLVNRMMTFGLDVRWRKQSARALALPAGARVLDLACGTGDFLRILSAAGLAPFGMDLSWGMLQANRTGLPLAQADGAALPVATASVDGITCGYALRNFTELGPVFGEFGRVVRPGGRISLLEVAEPDHGAAPGRPPDLVPQGRTGHRGTALGPRRLPLPPAFDRLPSRSPPSFVRCSPKPASPR